MLIIFIDGAAENHPHKLLDSLEDQDDAKNGQKRGKKTKHSKMQKKRHDGGSHSMQRLPQSNSMLQQKVSKVSNYNSKGSKNSKKSNANHKGLSILKQLEPEESLTPQNINEDDNCIFEGLQH